MKLSELNKQQQDAVKHSDGPLLIIAGAGTGKTTVITERIKYLIFEKKVEPSQILALTFTEKAASEMEERIDIEMPYGYTQMWISTFHSFCDRILRHEALSIGLNPAFRLMTEAETVLFLRNNIFKLKLNYFRPLGNPNKFLEALVNHFSRLKDEDISPLEYIKWAEKADLEKEEKEKYIELSNAFKTYEELKAKEGRMDYADLIGNTLKLFRKRPSVLSNYQDLFQHILVDEFQDTNYAQNELAVLLSRKNKNITVVGDDDQSIYRFRGSSISNIIQFKKHFPKAKIVTLTKNYRSTSEILNESYKLIQNNNPDRLEVKENINKKLTAERNIKGEKIEFIYKERVEDEAEEVIKKIEELTVGPKAKYKFRDVAILVRANDHSDPFVRSLERYKIPYQFLGPGRLFQQEEIKDLVSYLKVIYNFEDSVSLYRVLNMPIFNLDSIELASLINVSKRRNYSLFEALEKVDETYIKSSSKENVKKIAEMIRRHLKLSRKESAGQILYYFLQDSGQLKEMLEIDSDEKKVKNIAKLFDKLKTFEVENKSANIYDVVDWIDLSMEMGESPLASDTDWSQNNAVNILSVHSSKGLEFSVVFIVNLVAQRFPTRERREKIPIPQDLIKEILPVGDFHLEEERRLFYVGMTRAKDLLFLTASSFYGDGKRERKISPFVYETFGENEVSKQLKIKSRAAEELQLSLLEWAPKKEIEKIENPRIKEKITYLSYSQIQTFEVCPLHYKLKYIVRIPTPTTSALSFGISLHSTLRDFYQGVMNKSKEDINTYLERNWVNEGYLNKEAEIDAKYRAKKILSKYVKTKFDSKNLPIAIEKDFNFTLKRENGNIIKIGGRIDRIDQAKNGKIEIIDYKTGKNIPDEKKLATDLQLTLYALAASEVKEEPLNKNPDEVMLSLYYLESDTKLETIRTPEQLQEAKELLLKRADEIEKSDFLCSHNILCANCEYKMLCSTR